MTLLRRRLAGLFRRWAVRVDHDPHWNVRRGPTLDWSAYSDEELGITAGRAFTPGSGTIVRY
jgi:hypothetical protein